MVNSKLAVSLLVIHLVLIDFMACQTLAPVCNFQTFENQNSPGGKSIGVMPIGDCQYRCVQNNNCLYGFDYVISTKECFISTIPFTSGSSAPGINHYSCSTVNTYQSPATMMLSLAPLSSALPVIKSTCIWQAMPQTNTPNGMPDAAGTIESCKTRCIAKNGCQFGFDWVDSATIGTRCFFSTSNQYGSLQGVTHYSCNKSSPLYSATPDRLFVSGLLLMILSVVVQILA